MIVLDCSTNWSDLMWKTWKKLKSSSSNCYSTTKTTIRSWWWS